jgi:hypothetical protein
MRGKSDRPHRGRYALAAIAAIIASAASAVATP